MPARLFAARRFAAGHFAPRTFAIRALVVGVAIKAIAYLLNLFFPASQLLGVVAAIDTIGDVCLIIGGAVVAYRLYRMAQRRLLWRVRRKLILSAVFIGVIPALLIVTFFLLAVLLLFFNVSSYLMRSRVQVLVDQAHFMADTTALELQRALTPDERRDVVGRRQAGAASRYPNASCALVPADRVCAAASAPAVPLPPAVTITPAAAGPWAHMDAPVTLPAWISCAGQGGLLAYREGAGGTTRLAVRAIALSDARAVRFAVVVDLPVGESLARQLREETGIRLGAMQALAGAAGAVVPVTGRAMGTEPVTEPAPQAAEPRGSLAIGPANIVRGDGASATELAWVTFLDYIDWDTGRPGTVTASFQMSPLDVYRRISTTSLRRIGNLEFGQILLLLLAIVGGLFVVIQGVAFVMGLALARSITGSVHELFAGTERVRQGDFIHKIAIHSRDQLGELAASFNSMTASMEDLMRQKAEKERMEQELRIARQIQMSLLPQGTLGSPGLSISAHCEPAREVGGDYYDFFPLADGRLGVLIADVSGKGTSAALYMAELKGLMLSLSRLHRSPRHLLMDANRIIAAHLDARSFITVTYAIVDVAARTLTYVRAGHCPLIYLPGPLGGTPRRLAQVMAPNGMVMGLTIDNGERFDELLEEVVCPLGPGDLFVLFTDRITDAMNVAEDCFGELRLGAVVEEHGDAPLDVLRERIPLEIQTFTGEAPQHDDMTMLLLRVESAA